MSSNMVSRESAHIRSHWCSGDVHPSRCPIFISQQRERFRHWKL